MLIQSLLKVDRSNKVYHRRKRKTALKVKAEKKSGKVCFLTTQVESHTFHLRLGGRGVYPVHPNLAAFDPEGQWKNMISTPSPCEDQRICAKTCRVARILYPMYPMFDPD
ncbi:unnamed protein product [Durusdinium trenchii]|uniref:Uncharacterized protein n=1 Tax=Durusdinium trenchii TaxID=1381693 RepID=A0ABP0LEU5_9DINO